jgi:hypothetical protein
MEGRHDFLFWYEEGSRHKNKQKENNVTDSLLKTLQEGTDGITRGLITDAFDIQVPAKTYEWEYTAQPVLSPENITEWDIDLEQTYIVGISENGEQVAEHSGTTSIDPNDRPRPDGLIQLRPRNAVNSTPISIFLEVKTGSDKLSKSEMATYRGALGLSSPEFDEAGRGVQWLDVYRVLRNYLERTERQPDRFLLREFTEYLAWFELDHIVASHEGDYIKRLKFTGYPVEDRNKLKLKFIWDRDKGQSQSPAFTAAEFNTCLKQIPTDIREDTFVDGDLQALEDWARSKFGDASVDGGQRVAVSPAEEDGATVRLVESNAVPGMRVAFVDSEKTVESIEVRHKALYVDGSNLMPIWAGPSGRKNTHVPAILDPTAFRNLMSEMNEEARQTAFGGELPDTAALWEVELNG